MYLGTKAIRQKRYGTRWVPGAFGRGGRDETYCIEVMDAERHAYRCDHCGREFDVLLRAEEPFFCDCQRLISIAQN